MKKKTLKICTFLSIVMTIVLTFPVISSCLHALDSSEIIASPFYGYRGEEKIADDDYIEQTNAKPASLIQPRSVPTIVDLSSSIYFPPIGNQGEVGSCVAFATVYYQYTYEVNRARGIASDTESNIYSPQWAYYSLVDETNVRFDDKGKVIAIGVNHSKVYDFLKTHGALKLEDNPYSTTFDLTYPMPTDEAKMREALEIKLSSTDESYIDTSAYPITSNSSPTLNPLKLLLSSGKVLRVRSEFNFDSKVEDGVLKYYRCKTADAGHAIVIVGYDDNITCDINGDGIIEEGEKGAFKIANSWGPEWGNDGYVWIMYDALNVSTSVSGNWEASINDKGESRVGAFTSGGAISFFTSINVAETNHPFVAKISLSNTKRSAVRPILKKRLEGFTTFSLTNTYEKKYQIANSKVSDMVLLYDMGRINAENIICNNSWGVLLDNFNSSEINVLSVSLVDSLGNTIKTMTPTDDGTTGDYLCDLNLSLGDLNYSETLTTTDITRLNKILAGEITPSTCQEYLADVNLDGTIDTKDVTRLINIISTS